VEIYPGSTCTLLDNGIHHCKEGILIKVSSRQNVLAFQKFIAARINAIILCLGWLITLLPYGHKNSYMSHMMMMALVCLRLVHQSSMLVLLLICQKENAFCNVTCIGK